MRPREALAGLLTGLGVLHQAHIAFARPIWTPAQLGLARLGASSDDEVRPVGRTREDLLASTLRWSDGMDGLVAHPASHPPSTTTAHEFFLSHLLRTLSWTREPSSDLGPEGHGCDSSPPARRLAPRDNTTTSLSAGLPSWFNVLIAVLVVVPILLGVGVASIALCGLCNCRCGRRVKKGKQQPSTTPLPEPTGLQPGKERGSLSECETPSPVLYPAKDRDRASYSGSETLGPGTPKSSPSPSDSAVEKGQETTR